MKKRIVMIFVLVAIVIFIGITLYRFVENLGNSYQQLGLINEKEPVVVYTPGSLI